MIEKRVILAIRLMEPRRPLSDFVVFSGMDSGRRGTKGQVNLSHLSGGVVSRSDLATPMRDLAVQTGVLLTRFALAQHEIRNPFPRTLWGAGRSLASAMKVPRRPHFSPAFATRSLSAMRVLARPGGMRNAGGKTLHQ